MQPTDRPPATAPSQHALHRTFDLPVLVGVGLMVALLIVNAVLGHRNTSQLRDDAEWVAHTHEVLNLLGDVVLALVDAETGQRGYVLTGQKEFLEPYNAAVARIDGVLVALKDKTGDNSDQLARIAKLEEMVAVRMRQLKSSIIRRGTETTEEMGKRIATGKGRIQMDAIRHQVEEMEAVENELLASRAEKTAFAYRFAEFSNLLAAVSGLLTVGAFVWLLRRSLLARLRAAAVVQEQREWFRTTLASVGDAVIATDTRGRVTFLNPVAQTLTGWLEDEAFGQPLDLVFNIVNEQTRKPVENPAVRSLREGVIIGLANHTILISKTGRDCPIDDSTAPIRDEGGRVTGAVLVFRDVTEQRGAVRMIAESEARKRAILETALDCVITIDHDGKIVEFNPAAERTFGRRREDVLGRDMGELLVPPSLRASHRAGMARYLATGEGPVLNRRIELTALRADGTEFPVEVAITPLPGDGPTFFTGHVRDITDRKQAEIEAADRLRHAALDSDIGIALTGKNTLPEMLQTCAESLVRNLDAAFARIWTVDESQALLELQASAGLYTHRDGNHARIPIGQLKVGIIAKERKPHLTNEVLGDPRVPDQDWARREGLVAFAGYPLLVNDRTVGVMAIFARHVLSDATLKAMASAARAIALGIERKEMETQLRQFVADLSEADRRKNEFLAMLAHELRNPLAPIRNSMQILRMAGGDAQAIVAPTIDVMQRQVGQMVRLIDDLLDVNRITRGKIALNLERVELAQVIQHAVEAARPHFEQNGLKLTVTLPTKPITVKADLIRLAQAVGNLLNNAAKFTEKGRDVWLTAERVDGEAVIRVRDTGIGIAADQLAHIFDMFVQVDTSLERTRSGLGIGLALVKKLIEAHDGTVEVFSAGLGQGSEFVLRLPVLVEQPISNAATTPVDAATAPLHRILIVDDNRDSADSLATLLQLSGHDVRTAYDGLAGVEMAEQYRPDVILLDIGLPHLNGYEAAQRIRQQPWGRDLFLAALTGWGQDADRQRSADAGFDTHLVKPVDFAVLTKLLADVKQVGVKPN